MTEIDLTNQRVFSRNNHPEEVCKKDVPKYLAKFTGKNMYMSIFLNEVVGRRPVTINSAERLFYRLAFLQNTCERLPVILVNTWKLWASLII